MQYFVAMQKLMGIPLPRVNEMTTKSLRHLLMLRYVWIESQLQERAQGNGYGFVTPAVTRMFGQMGLKPIGISELARRMVISRQAVHQLVQEAVGYGLVEIIPSTKDKRTKLVQFTEAGRKMYRNATETLESIEGDLEAKIGKDKVEILRSILSEPW